jgi:hypothetical protein
MNSKSNSRRETPEEAERWLNQLKTLYLENSDEDFLILVVGQLDRLVGTPFDDLYDEIADRALLNALHSGDFKRIATAVDLLRPAAAQRPMAQLSQAVLFLAEGRIEKVSAYLEKIGDGDVVEEDVAEWFTETVPPLWVLSLSGGKDPVERSAAKMSSEVTSALCAVSLPLRRQLRDYLRLERSLWHHYRVLGLAELPQGVGLHLPEGRLLWSFFRALKGFHVGIYRPGPRTVRKLEQVLEDAQKAHDSTGCGELFDAAEERLWLFRRLLDLERVLGRIEPPVEVARRRLREFLVNNKNRLIRLLGQKPPALLGNLEYAWRHRWHELLEKVGRRFDSAIWSEFYAFCPQVLSYYLVPRQPVSGAHQAMWFLRVDRLLNGDEYRELTQVLAQQSRRESLRPNQLACLWACELWAWRRVLSRVQSLPSFSESLARRQGTLSPSPEDDLEVPEILFNLGRLEEMAGALKQRFSAEECKEVARVLRDETLLLASQFGFSDSLRSLVEALLESLPGDLGLLLLGLMVAQGSGDERAQQVFTSQIEGRKFLRGDLVPFLPLLGELVRAPAQHAVSDLKEEEKGLEDKGWKYLEGLFCVELRRPPEALEPHRFVEIERVGHHLTTLEQCMREALDHPEETLCVLFPPPAMMRDSEAEPEIPIPLGAQDLETLLGPWRRKLLLRILLA